jgi:hypothetical protein
MPSRVIFVGMTIGALISGLPREGFGHRHRIPKDHASD